MRNLLLLGFGVALAVPLSAQETAVLRCPARQVRKVMLL